MRVSRDFVVLPSPRRHDYSDLFNGSDTDDEKISQALHHVDENESYGHKVWLYDLQNGESTSSHTHEKPELERVLYGKVVVNGEVLFAGQGKIVYPGGEHRGQAIGGAIVLCALMEASGQNKADVHKF